MPSPASAVTSSNAQILKQAPLEQSAKSTPAASTTSTITSAKDSSSAEQSKKPALSGFKAFWESIADFLWKCITCGFFKKQEEVTNAETNKKPEETKANHQKAELKYPDEAKIFEAFCQEVKQSQEKNDELPQIKLEATVILDIIALNPKADVLMLQSDINTSGEIDAKSKTRYSQYLSHVGKIDKFEEAVRAEKLTAEWMTDNNMHFIFMHYLEKNVNAPSLVLSAFKTLKPETVAFVLEIYRSAPGKSKATQEDLLALLKTSSGLNDLKKIGQRYFEKKMTPLNVIR